MSSEVEGPDEETQRLPKSHDDIVQMTKTALNTLIKNDPLLCDLPEDVTLDEIKAQVAVLQGTALSINVHREDGEVVKVIVDQRDATVSHLKRAFMRSTQLRLLRKQGRKVAISWKHIWKTNWLVFNGVKLQNDNAKLRDLGITNRANVSFAKRYRDKLKSNKVEGC
ncbi:Hypothetical predicted protein [Cloeon dipterum]|uniref:SNRNP25 ubiquitin-like domain-containing protein n=1 Tax=Cloeon dipterum TaxID=197152 RepID=A0A8S1DIA1_9INSE|nr:Hypothetical predicted protein [Cloeon dipterum]